jgi:SOS-response transcriptional repressor LexA
MIGLTKRQNDLLTFIIAYKKREEDLPPSFDEMAAALSISKSQVHRLIEGLEGRGAIFRLKKRARSIEVIDRQAMAHLGFLPANHRQFLAHYAAKNKTTTEAVLAGIVRDWAVRTAA